jgi:ABC-2 type transport system permease protein
MRTILVILRKEFIQVFRNKSMIPIIFAMPMVQLLVLAFAVTFEIKNINLDVVDQDNSPVSRELISKFQGSSFFTIKNFYASYEQASTDLKNGKAHQLLIIPQHFERDLYKENKAKLQLITNAIDGSAAALMNAYGLSIIRDYNKELIAQKMGDDFFTEPVNLSYSFWFNPELNYTTYMVPGILVLLVTMIGIFLSGMNVVREKEIGTIEQINVSPIKKYQFIAGKLLPFWFIALFELAFGLILARIFFHIPILGSVWLIFGVASVYLLAVMGIGLFLATVSDTQQQSMFLSWFFMVIFILMSGLFTPVENMPVWAQNLNTINPIAYFIRIMRMIMLKGSGFRDVLEPFAAIAVYAISMLSLAIWRYRKVS